jgi:hypothetical protein
MGDVLLNAIDIGTAAVLILWRVLPAEIVAGFPSARATHQIHSGHSDHHGVSYE